GDSDKRGRAALAFLDLLGELSCGRGVLKVGRDGVEVNPGEIVGEVVVAVVAEVVIAEIVVSVIAEILIVVVVGAVVAPDLVERVAGLSQLSLDLVQADRGARGGGRGHGGEDEGEEGGRMSGEQGFDNRGHGQPKRAPVANPLGPWTNSPGAVSVRAWPRHARNRAI